MGSGYWWVRRASRAVKEHRPAVNTMKNGSSFLGYTDTSWKAVKVINILILTAFNNRYNNKDTCKEIDLRTNFTISLLV